MKLKHFHVLYIKYFVFQNNNSYGRKEMPQHIPYNLVIIITDEYFIIPYNLVIIITDDYFIEKNIICIIEKILEKIL